MARVTCGCVFKWAGLLVVSLVAVLGALAYVYWPDEDQLARMQEGLMRDLEQSLPPEEFAELRAQYEARQAARMDDAPAGAPDAAEDAPAEAAPAPKKPKPPAKKAAKKLDWDGKGEPPPDSHWHSIFNADGTAKDVKAFRERLLSNPAHLEEMEAQGSKEMVAALKHGTDEQLQDYLKYAYTQEKAARKEEELQEKTKESEEFDDEAVPAGPMSLGGMRLLTDEGEEIDMEMLQARFTEAESKAPPIQGFPTSQRCAVCEANAYKWAHAMQEEMARPLPPASTYEHRTGVPPLSVRLAQVIENTCMNISGWEYDYGVQPAKEGPNLVVGPGISVQEHQYEEGSYAMVQTTHGNNMGMRFAVHCRDLMSEFDEIELSEELKATGSLTEMMCYKKGRQCYDRRKKQKAAEKAAKKAGAGGAAAAAASGEL